MIWLVAILAFLVALPFLSEALRRPADKRQAPGQFAGTPGGPTHFRWDGLAQDKVAVCIHGLTTPSFVFDPLAQALVASGYRVLSYDLPGRGFSPAQPGEQDAEFFLTQLRGLLDDQGVEDIDLLVGYSMGGAIASIFAAAEPDRVERIVLLAPAGLYHDSGALAGLIRRLPVLGDWAMLSFGGAILRRGIGGDGTFARRQRAETRKRGYLRSILSSMRHMLPVHLGPVHKEIVAMGVPLLAIWGEEDRVIPISNVGRLAEVNRKAHQVTLAGADHRLPYSHADEVAAAIRGFLEETAR